MRLRIAEDGEEKVFVETADRLAGVASTV